jgi:hypothetical protein
MEEKFLTDFIRNDLQKAGAALAAAEIAAVHACRVQSPKVLFDHSHSKKPRLASCLKSMMNEMA